jgi:hypothetical protein
MKSIPSQAQTVAVKTHRADGLIFVPAAMSLENMPLTATVVFKIFSSPFEKLAEQIFKICLWYSTAHTSV